MHVGCDGSQLTFEYDSLPAPGEGGAEPPEVPSEPLTVSSDPPKVP